MDDRITKYLEDIKRSIQSIHDYLGDKRDFNEFQGNKLLKRGIEREFEIIGEAMNRILKIEPEINIKHAKRIVGLRNHIIHAYDSVLDEILWGIIVNHLPKLQEEVKRLLNESTNNKSE